jgi:hypothetical protein
MGRLAAVAVVGLGLAGCQTAGPRRVASTEPGLTGSAEAGTPVVEAPVRPASSLTWVDRHPLFFKPRDYYEGSTSNNKFMKTATAAVIGVPAGLFGELRQIVVGTPSQPRY